MKFQSAIVSIIAATSVLSLSSAFTQPNFAIRNASPRLSATVAPDEVAAQAPPEKSVFLTPETAKACIEAVGSPLYAYSKESLSKAADECLAFPNAYGLTVRYAMKASPNKAILQLFSKKGIHIDASSGFEVCFLSRLYVIFISISI